MRTLIALGASPNVFGPAQFFKRPLLHYAVYAGSATVDGLVEAVREFHGNEIEFMNREDARKETALHVAAREGNADAVVSLLKTKASIKWLVDSAFPSVDVVILAITGLAKPSCLFLGLQLEQQHVDMAVQSVSKRV